MSDEPILWAFRCKDQSKKLTSYFCKLSSNGVFLDFGSDDIASFKNATSAKAVFISHEHFDHWGGLINKEAIDIIQKREIPIYATETTKELISYSFENVIKVDMANDTRFINACREVIKSIRPILYFEKTKVNQTLSFTFYPSGHTYGSSCILIEDDDMTLLYTGDFDYETNDPDRCCAIPVTEHLDYLLVDSTNLYARDSKSIGKQDIIDTVNKCMSYEGGKNLLSAKLEKIPFLGKTIARIDELSRKYIIVYDTDVMKYLNVIVDNGYNPYVQDKLIAGSPNFQIIYKDRKPLYLTSKRDSIGHNFPKANFAIDLHIFASDFIDFLDHTFINKPKIFLSHYAEENKKKIIGFMNGNKNEAEFHLVEEGNNPL
jgi:glyoxylase-like metal-dependent hydrolase (beta-lactamase superfamily II)